MRLNKRLREIKNGENKKVNKQKITKEEIKNDENKKGK